MVFALYVFGVAWLQAAGSHLISPKSLYIPRTIDAVICLWLMWVGSAIGSFLNVVAWRMPRGESVNGRSYCPRCQTQLKARDNFPVFGWLALGGRCRTCRLPISGRYPIVEAAVGLSLTALGISQLYRLSLPHQPVHWHGGPFWAPVVDSLMLLTLLYHAVAVATLWAFGLIRIDGKRLPPTLLWFAVVTAVLPMLAYPDLMVVPWQTVYPWGWSPSGLYLDAVIRIITSLAAAVVLSRYLTRSFCPGADPKLDPLGSQTTRLMNVIAITAIPAIVVGWQAIAAIIVIASLIAAGLRRLWFIHGDALGRFALAMPLAVTFQLTFWRTLDLAAWWPTAGSPPWTILAWAGGVLFVPLWLRDQSAPMISDHQPDAMEIDSCDAKADEQAESVTEDETLQNETPEDGMAIEPPPQQDPIP